MKRVELPTPADLSASSLEWACGLLGEDAKSLIVHFEDTRAAVDAVAGVPDLWIWIGVDLGLRPDEWIVRGDTCEVHSEGS